jgi:hypothetical protein
LAAFAHQINIFGLEYFGLNEVLDYFRYLVKLVQEGRDGREGEREREREKEGEREREGERESRRGREGQRESGSEGETGPVVQVARTSNSPKKKYLSLHHLLPPPQLWK